MLYFNEKAVLIGKKVMYGKKQRSKRQFDEGSSLTLINVCLEKNKKKKINRIRYWRNNDDDTRGVYKCYLL